jgi:hypothetical protein
MEPIVVKTIDARLSDFLLFQTRLDKFQAQSAESAEAPIPHLAFLRVELSRLRPGMSDFLFKVSSPGPTPGAKPTVVTLRGERSFAKLEGLVKAANVIFKEMKKREDDTHAWDNADAEYLAKMLVNQCKFFILNLNTETLSFTTDALH